MASRRGVSLSEAIERLAPKRRGKGRLAPAPAREGIATDVVEVLPSADPLNASGLVSPLVEQAYAGTTYYNFTSSCGFIVFEFADSTTYIDDGGSGSAVVFQHLDPDA